MSEEECQSPRLSRWLGAAASARGRGHVSKDLPCQDASLAVVDDGVAMVITSDGAGSAGFSDQGAEIAVRCTAEVLAQNAPWDDLDALKDRVIDACTAALEARARDLAAAVGQLAATLSFVALHRDSCVVGNLGDGLVAGYSNSAASLLTTQAKGEFANETVFLTSSSARRRLELRRCRADAYDGFVVMTDGAAESLFQRRSGTLAPAVDRMLRWLDENTPGAVEKALTESALPMPTSSMNCSARAVRSGCGTATRSSATTSRAPARMQWLLRPGCRQGPSGVTKRPCRPSSSRCESQIVPTGREVWKLVRGRGTLNRLLERVRGSPRRPRAIRDCWRTFHLRRPGTSAAECGR